MINTLLNNPLLFFLVFPGLLMTITIHEFAHCFVADKLGDPTPRAKDRLTLDPRAHLDLYGVIAMLLTRFGWGKPAPFDPYNLKNPVKDTALIAAAGVGSNLLLAGILALILRFTPTTIALLDIALAQILILNIYLAFFNLLPIGPLDGAKILKAFLPKRTAYEYEQFMERYGLMLLFLMVFPIINGQTPANLILGPIVNLFLNLLI